MKRVLIAGVALALLIPVTAFAQSVFDGSWKLVPASLHFTHDTHVVSVKNGVWECEGCGPSITRVKADGADHHVAGSPAGDTSAVEIVNDHTVKATRKHDGKVVSVETVTVAADGKTAIDREDHFGAHPFSDTVLVVRDGQPVAGEQAFTGRWNFDHFISMSNPDTMVYKVDGNRFSSNDAANGGSYVAGIGGKSVPYMHDGKPDGTVAVARVGARGLRSTFEKDGKVTHTSTITVAPDGKTLEMVTHVSHGPTITMTHDKVS